MRFREVRSQFPVERSLLKLLVEQRNRSCRIATLFCELRKEAIVVRMADKALLVACDDLLGSCGSTQRGVGLLDDRKIPARVVDCSQQLDR
jgi:hypothetical protein